MATNLQETIKHFIDECNTKNEEEEKLWNMMLKK